MLLEELRKAGCEVVFLHRVSTDDPQDQLFLQIQGAVAEYERAVIGERLRRGKLQKARADHWLGGKAPFGYRYIPKRDDVPGYFFLTPVGKRESRFPTGVHLGPIRGSAGVSGPVFPSAIQSSDNGIYISI